jgi:UDP-N-acetylglucosamine 4,6-dehydratase
MRAVLVTGASGFLGRALAARLLKMDIPRICLLSSSESRMHEARQILGEDSRLRYMVGNVRDPDRMLRAMHGIATVIHAAALKRVEVGQENPREMIATNVQGTVNTLNAAEDCGVGKFVFVSSDKACEPTNLYGATKMMGEGLVLAPRGELLPRCCVVRYGNVAGSTGSVIPIWRRAMAENKPIRLTDPQATRFWMTRDQAVEFVIAAVLDGENGEMRVPELPAYRLGDLAQAMGFKVWKQTGLQPGEKLHERMGVGNDSNLARRMTVGELREALDAI